MSRLLIGRLRTLAMAAALSAIPAFGLALTAAPAGADTTCDTIVLDTTPGHALGSASATQQASQSLEDAGYDVRVRVVPLAPGSSIDSTVASQLQACPTWGSGLNHLKNNLLIVALGIYPESVHGSPGQYGAYAGHAISRMGDVRFHDVRMSVKPLMRNRQFDAGTAALEDRMLSAVENASAGAPNAPSTASASHSSGKLFLYVLIGIAVVVVACVLLFLLVSGHKRRRQEAVANADAKTRALAACDRANEAINALPEVESDLKLTVQILSAQLGDHARGLQSNWDAAEVKLNYAFSSIGRVKDRPDLTQLDKAGDHERTTDQWTEIAQTYDSVTAQAAEADLAFKAVSAQCTALHKEIDSADDLLAKARAALSNAQNDSDALIAVGAGVPGVDATVKAVTTALAQADQFLRGGKAPEALARIRDAQAHLASFNKAMEPNRLRLSGLKDRLRNVTERASKCNAAATLTMLTALYREFAAPNLKPLPRAQSIRDAQSAVTADLAAASTALDNRRTWGEVDTHLASADAQLGKLEHDCTTIRIHDEALRHMRDGGAAGLLTELAEQIETALTTIAGHRYVRHTKFTEAVEAVRDTDVPALKALLATERPDFGQFAVDQDKAAKAVTKAVTDSKNEYKRNKPRPAPRRTTSTRRTSYGGGYGNDGGYGFAAGAAVGFYGSDDSGGGSYGGDSGGGGYGGDSGGGSYDSGGM